MRFPSTPLLAQALVLFAIGCGAEPVDEASEAESAATTSTDTPTLAVGEYDNPVGLDPSGVNLGRLQIHEVRADAVVFSVFEERLGDAKTFARVERKVARLREGAYVFKDGACEVSVRPFGVRSGNVEVRAGGDECPRLMSDPLLFPMYGYLPMKNYVAFEGKYVSATTPVALALYNHEYGDTKKTGKLEVSVLIPGPTDASKKIVLFEEIAGGVRKAHVDLDAACAFDVTISGGAGSEALVLKQTGTCAQALGASLDLSGSYAKWQPRAR